MTSREKILASLNHKPGPVAVDFGSTHVSGIHVSCVAALRRHHGLREHPVKVFEPYQMLGLVEDDLRDALGIDATGLFGRDTMFGFPTANWREWRAPWGQVMLVPGAFLPQPAPDGGVLMHPGGDLSAPASGHMPRDGFFFDAIIRQEPIDEDKLDPLDNCEEFALLSGEAIEHWRGELAGARDSRRAVVASPGGMGFGDIALVPATSLKRPRGIRDVAEWYMALVERRDYVHAIFERQCDIALKNLETFAAIAGDTVDALFVCGTDFGTQLSQFCSLETFNTLYAPYYRRVNDWVHTRTKWKTIQHSCGAVHPLMPGFIDAGFDIVNPVQCSATDMEPARLKREFGGRIVFWGGGVDTQKTLPFGTPAGVRAEVLGRLRIFAPGGGFVFNAIHNIQALTPTENIVAMIDAVREYNTAGA
jgi:hypothetical protein